MPGTLIACKTAKGDDRIDAWWGSITGSKSEALKAAILFYLDNKDNGRGRAANPDGDDPDLVKVLKGIQTLLETLNTRLGDNGVLDVPPARPRTYVNHKRESEPVEVEPAEATADDLARATGNFLNLFG